MVPRTGFLSAVLVALFAFFVPSIAAAAASPVEEGVHELYEDGLRLFYGKEYKKAVAIFDKIEALYPFSQMAIDGSLIAAVSHYELGNYVEAATLAESYIEAYPNSESVDYAYYVRILAKYMQIPDLGLDQSVALEVRELASGFLSMFPNSRYLAEISARLDAAKEHLAAREFLIGKFYLKRGVYVAAIKRFSSLVDEYADSVYLQESLYRLVEAYVALGDRESAAAYISRLDEGSIWRARAEHYLSAAVGSGGDQLREEVIVYDANDAQSDEVGAEEMAADDGEKEAADGGKESPDGDHDAVPVGEQPESGATSRGSVPANRDRREQQE
ncbi:outer membrane protein assembly factor BamD [Anaplasma capra]|nr:outer membrane protein assembly factor BamD [Anaplasma capra]